MEWDREREPRGGCAEPGEKPEQSEPRCKSCGTAPFGRITVHVEPGVLLGLPRGVGGHAGVAGGVSGQGLAKLQDTARGLQLFPNTERSRVTPLSPCDTTVPM